MKLRMVLLSVVAVVVGVAPLSAQITDAIPGTLGSPCPQAYWAAPGNPSPSIFLSKPCVTSDPGLAYADLVSPLEGGPVAALTSVGFDYMNGGHCGAGAPRVNLDLDNEGEFATALGCSSGTQTDLGNGWTRVTFNTAQIMAAVNGAGGNYATSTLTDIYIAFDEGTDTAGGTPGQVYLDNFMINGVTLGNTPPSFLAIPTLSQYGLIGLALALAALGTVVLKRS